MFRIYLIFGTKSLQIHEEMILNNRVRSKIPIKITSLEYVFKNRQFERETNLTEQSESGSNSKTKPYYHWRFKLAYFFNVLFYVRFFYKDMFVYLTLDTI